MFKRIGLIAVLVIASLAALPAHADQELVVRPLSQRYSLTIPAHLYSTDAVTLTQLQMIFPLEDLTFADSEATLEQVANLSIDRPAAITTFNGMLMSLTVWSKGLLDVIGLDAATIGEALTRDVPIPLDTHPITFSNGETQPLYTQDLGAFDFLYFFAPDSEGNVILGMGLAEDDQINTVVEVLSTLKIQQFDDSIIYEAAALPITAQILPGALQANLPGGWWVMQTEYGMVMAMPTMDTDFLTAVSRQEDSLAGSGAVMMVMTEEKSELPTEVFDSSGRLDPKALLESGDLPILENGVLQNAEARIWQNSHKLSGVSIEFTAPEQNLIGIMLILDNDAADLHVVYVGATPDQWEQLRPIFMAVLDTLRRVKLTN